MQYDRALKELVQDIGTDLVHRLAGSPPVEWLNVELPRAETLRVDLVARLADDNFFHLEFQTDDENDMLFRQLDYCSAFIRRMWQEPDQTVVYLGKNPPRMPTAWNGRKLRFHFVLLHLAEMDGEDLLNSPSIGDAILAVLCKTPDTKERVQRIIRRIKELEEGRQRRLLRLLLLISGLRDLTKLVNEEAERMGVSFDPMQDTYMRELFEKGVGEGREEGRLKGKLEGKLEGRWETLAELLIERFGPLPDWARERLQDADSDRLRHWTRRVLSAASLEDALRG